MKMNGCLSTYSIAYSVNVSGKQEAKSVVYFKKMPVNKVESVDKWEGKILVTDARDCNNTSYVSMTGDRKAQATRSSVCKHISQTRRVRSTLNW